MTDAARDKYLRRKYGIRLDDYQRMMDEQNGKCFICRKPGVTRALAVDHCHKWKYVKITAWKELFEWHVSCEYRGVKWWWAAKTKNGAIRALRQRLQRASVRGLLCPNCNAGLRKFSDDADRFDRAAKYLRRWATESCASASNVVEDGCCREPAIT